MSPTLHQLAENFGTPFYVYSTEELESTYKSLRIILPKAVDIFYSIKANPNMAICAELKNLGACAEVCSLIELLTVIKAGFDSKNIIFVGPAKKQEEILACLEHNIYAIVCESKQELELISKLASIKKIVAPVALRVNPSFFSKSALLKMGGQASQFGMDEDQVLNDAELFQQPNINIMGLHVYNGTRILDAKVIAENTANVFDLAKKLSKLWSVKFSMVDIGGGLGVPYFSDEKSLDLNQLQMLLHPIINQYLNHHPHTRIILETGRFLVANSGKLVSKILYKKTSKGKKYLVTDGGTHCHMAVVGVGSLIKRNFPISLESKAVDSSTKSSYNITGPLCTPGDLVGKEVELPYAKEDDLIVVHRVGAYGPTASPVMFLSHGFPVEILVKHNKAYVIRQRQTTDDFLKNQSMLTEFN